MFVSLFLAGLGSLLLQLGVRALEGGGRGGVSHSSPFHLSVRRRWGLLTLLRRMDVIDVHRKKFFFFKLRTMDYRCLRKNLNCAPRGMLWVSQNGHHVPIL